MSYFFLSLPVFFFTFHFVFRLMPGLLMNTMMEEFAIDATSFGTFGAAFFYGHALFQIPLALFIQKYGVRTILSICSLLCGLSILIFVTTSSWMIVVFSRFLLGASCAAALLGTFQTISSFFDKRLFGKILGLCASIGFLGAVYAGKPTSLLLQSMGWRTASLALSSVFFLLSALIFIFYRDPQKSTPFASFTLSDFKGLVKNGPIWIISIVMICMVGTFEGFANAWGVSFLMSVFHFTKPNAAGLMSYLFVGFIIGSLVIPWIAERFGSTTVISGCGILMALLLSTLLLHPSFLSEMWLFLFLSCIGFLCAYQILVLSLAAQVGAANPYKNLATIATSFVNCMKFLGASLFHNGIGFVMDYTWQGTYSDINSTLKYYDATSFTIGLCIIPILALVGSFLIKKVHINASSY